MGGKFFKTLAAGAAVAAITICAAGAATPAAAAAVWVHGGGWHGGWGWHGGYGGWGWRGGYGGWGWRTGWNGGWGWRGPGWYGYRWGVPAVAVGVGVPAYYPYAYPAYAPGNPGCWQVRAVYSQAGVYLGNRTVNVCQ